MNIRISPVSLVLGALITFGLFLLMGQAGPGTPPASWGPPKKSMVNIFRQLGAPVAGGGHLVLYQVPNDRWLTITAATATPQGCQCPWPTGGTAQCLRWAELSGGVYVEKGFAGHGDTSIWETPSAGSGATGWVFRPGSQVVIRNVDVSPCTVWDYSIIGYESRD